MRRPGCGRHRGPRSPGRRACRPRHRGRGDEGQAPEEGRMVAAGPLDRSSGSWTTSSMTPPRRKNACRGAPAGVGSSRIRRRSRPAASSAATVRPRSGVIATRWSIAVTPFGWAGASPGGGRSERVVASPSSSVDSILRSDQPANPPPPASAARRTRMSPMTQRSPSTANPSAFQGSGASRTILVDGRGHPHTLAARPVELPVRCRCP